MLEDVLQTELERITGKQVAYSSWQAGFLESAKFVLENKRAVYHIYNSIGREPLEKYLYQMTWDLMVGLSLIHISPEYKSAAPLLRFPAPEASRSIPLINSPDFSSSAESPSYS